jgi:hypothetical protein
MYISKMSNSGETNYHWIVAVLKAATAGTVYELNEQPMYYYSVIKVGLICMSYKP